MVTIVPGVVEDQIHDASLLVVMGVRLRTSPNSLGEWVDARGSTEHHGACIEREAVGGKKHVDLVALIWSNFSKGRLDDGLEGDGGVGDERVEIDPPDPVVFSGRSKLFQHHHLVPHELVLVALTERVIDMEIVAVTFGIFMFSAQTQPHVTLLLGDESGDSESHFSRLWLLLVRSPSIGWRWAAVWNGGAFSDVELSWLRCL